LNEISLFLDGSRYTPEVLLEIVLEHLLATPRAKVPMMAKLFTEALSRDF
jgi:hypothetical protein